MAEVLCCVEHFVGSLPRVRQEDLPAGSECMICQDQYGTPNADDGTTEHTIVLPCGHLVGSVCIRRWLSERGSNTCPYCRRELFPPIPTDSDNELDYEVEETESRPLLEDALAVMASLGLSDADRLEVIQTFETRRVDIEAMTEIIKVSAEDRIEAHRTYISRERALYRLLLPEGPELPLRGTSLPELQLMGESHGDLSCLTVLGEELHKWGAFDLVALRGIRPVEWDEPDWFLWEVLGCLGYVWHPRMLLEGVEVASGWSLGNGGLMATIDSVAYRGQLATVWNTK